MSSNEVRLEKTEIGKLLFSVMAERDALRAENEQLTADVQARAARHVEAKAENERLRAALTEIMQSARSLDYAIHLARVTLTESPR